LFKYQVASIKTLEKQEIRGKKKEPRGRLQFLCGSAPLREKKEKKNGSQRHKVAKASGSQTERTAISLRLGAFARIKIRRGGLFWERISYHNELSLISCLLAL
jgi:hypothetical protein